MESLEDFLERSSEILRAHKDGLWAQKNELLAGCSESIRTHSEGLRRSQEELLAGLLEQLRNHGEGLRKSREELLESIRTQRDGLIQRRESLRMRSSELIATVSNTLIAEGLFFILLGLVKHLFC